MATRSSQNMPYKLLRKKTFFHTNLKVFIQIKLTNLQYNDITQEYCTYTQQIHNLKSYNLI